MSLYDKITKNYNYKNMKNYNIFKPFTMWANVNSELDKFYNSPQIKLGTTKEDNNLRNSMRHLVGSAIARQEYSPKGTNFVLGTKENGDFLRELFSFGRRPIFTDEYFFDALIDRENNNIGMEYGKNNPTSSKEEVIINNKYKPLFDEAEKKYDNLINKLYKLKQEGKITEEFYQNAIDYSDEALKVDNILSKWSKEVENLKGKKLTPNDGQLYKVAIPKDDVLLRENLPFSEQSEFVQEKVKELFNNEIENGEKYLKDIIKHNYNGEDIYETIRERKAFEELGESLGGHYRNKYNNEFYKQAGLLSNNYGIKGISYNGGIDGEARVIFSPDDIDIVRKYYNQPEAIEYFKKLPNYGAVVNSFDSVPIDKKYWKQYAKDNLVGKSVYIPNYTTVSFTRNNLGKDYSYNMPEYPTLFDQLKGSNYAFSTNYKNEKDRIYDHFVNTNDNRLFDYLIEVIKDNEGDYHHNYKMMKNISRGDNP